MRFNFGPGKHAANLGKHGLSLAAAAELSWEAALAWLNDRAHYGEVTIVALARIGNTLYFVAVEERESTWRMSSLRRANRHEVNHDVKAIQEDQPEDADI